MPIKKPKNELAGKKKDEMTPIANPMPSQETSEELYTPERSFSQIDSIAQRIASLTENLQQPSSRADWDSANEKIIAFKSELARLQFQIQKQTRVKNQSQVGNELLGAVGEQLRSLTEGLHKTTSQNNQHLKGNLSCIQAILEELKADIESLTQQNNSSNLPTTLEEISQQVSAIEGLDISIQDLIQAVQQIHTDNSKHVTLETLKLHFDSLAAELPPRGEVEKLESKIDSTIDLLKTSRVSENREDSNNTKELSEQIHSLGQWLENTIGRPDDTAATSDEIQALVDKVDSLQKTIESQSTDPKNEERLNEMDNRLSQLASRWTKLETSIDAALSVSTTNVNTEARIDEIGKKLDTLVIQLQSQDPITQPVEMDFQAQFKLVNDELAQTQSMVNQLTDLISQKLDTDKNQDKPTPDSDALTPPDYALTPPADALTLPAAPPEPQSTHELASEAAATPKEIKTTSSSPSWEQQKQALLRDHGVSTPFEKETDSEPDVYEPSIQSAISEPEAGTIANTESQTSIGEDTPTPELEELKSQLEERLRQAEIEISIERAKLHKERRELETIQNEIHRQQVKLDAEGQPIRDTKDGKANKTSDGRWSRFLGN